jgi:hypothetical protein
LTNQTQTPSSNTNNPCPSGFRVPTQHEWVLLGSEGGSSTSTSGDNFSVPNGTPTTSGLVWVPVKNGVPSTDWTSDNSESTLSFYNYENNNGYALYTSDTWNGIADKDRLTDLEDPEPLMFLPAAGCRNYGNGRVYYTGNNGYYWSSTVNGGYGRHMYFLSSNVSATNYDGRAYGFSVRCLSEF